MNLEERIGIYYTTLTKTERRVYQAILSNPIPAVKLSIQEAAKRYGVSVASIQRFVKKIGYKGYPEFKLDVASTTASLHARSEPINETRMQRVIHGYIRTFQALEQINLEPQLENLVCKMKDYKSIKAIGIGNSGLSAEQLVYSMYSEDRFIEPVIDKIKVDYLVRALTKEDLLIVFSITGSTSTYQKLLTKAKQKGAPSFLITMNQETSLSKLTSQTMILPSTHINDTDNLPYQVDNRTILYSFSEVISYYYATLQKRK